MAALHMTRLAFRCPDLPSLQARVAGRVVDGELRVATRMRPRRSAELVGGCLYWIVQHRLVARQRILRFDDRDDGRIDIVLDAEMVGVPAVPRRAHQGWRYLADDDAPRPGDNDDSGIAALPPLLYGKLAALALI